MKTITAPQDESNAAEYIDLLRENKFDQIKKDLDPSLEDAATQNTLINMAAMFPAQRPVSVKVVGMEKFRNRTFSSVNITLEYEFPGKWLLANVATKKSSGVVTITGFHVSQIPDSLEHRNRFTLVARTTDQYSILLLAVASVVLSLYAFVVCIRTKMGKKKMLWSVLTLLGLGQLGIDWTTGEKSFNALAFHLPPGGAAAPPYGAWVVYVSLPVGALLFLFLRDTLGVPAYKSDQTSVEG
jgi:hypothetical protein